MQRVARGAVPRERDSMHRTHIRRPKGAPCRENMFLQKGTSPVYLPKNAGRRSNAMESSEDRLEPSKFSDEIMQEALGNLLSPCTFKVCAQSCGCERFVLYVRSQCRASKKELLSFELLHAYNIKHSKNQIFELVLAFLDVRANGFSIL